MNADTVQREQLRTLLRGGHAHMNFTEAVAQFPTDSMNVMPPNVSYTPWHLLEHLRITQLEIFRDHLKIIQFFHNFLMVS